MSENENVQPSSISQALTYEEIGEFWDTHSLADYQNQTHEVEFEVRASRGRRVAIDPGIYSRLEVSARARGLAPETLVNLWLAERLSAMDQAPAAA